MLLGEAGDIQRDGAGISGVSVLICELLLMKETDKFLEVTSRCM